MPWGEQVQRYDENSQQSDQPVKDLHYPLRRQRQMCIRDRLGFRNGIERFLNNPPSKKSIHIATDPALQQSNQMLDAKLKNLKQQGEQSVKHKPCIENENLRRLKESAVMSPSTPQGLLNNVWFLITL